MDEKIIWRCPSNIALVKYWGKRDNQIPCNASLSVTLRHAVTETTLLARAKTRHGIELEYRFEGRQNPGFQKRVLDYVSSFQEYFPVLTERSIYIDSRNSFPHSAGIASSASAFGALALVLLSASEYHGDDFFDKASFLSRLGSGSACRSMFAPYALWGRLDEVAGSSDEKAIPVTGVHEEFSDLRDAILIIDEEPKKVSSSAGHQLMKGHAYAENRFLQANKNCLRMLEVLKRGDYEEFVSIIEREALALHAMMMTSDDYYLLMKPGTIHAIHEVMNFRKETKIPVGFTLDAGPTVHLLYAGRHADQVLAFLDSQLKPFTKNIIFDEPGSGPEKIMQ